MTYPALKLRTRIGLYFLGIVGTWTIFVLVLVGDLLASTSRTFLRDRGAELARVLAAECAPHVYSDDVASVDRLLAARTTEPSDVRYLVVLGNAGEVVWSTFAHGVPAGLLGVPHPTDLGAGVRVQLLRSTRELLYDYEVREGGIRLRMGMSLVSADPFVEKLATYVLWIGMGALLAVFAVALHVSRPIEALMIAVARAAPGAKGGPPQGPQDWTLETSVLATWFQDLIHRLDERTRQLDKSQKLAYVGEVSTSIAHEVNNPLGVVVLTSEFLAKRAARGEFEPAVAEEVERVRAAAMRATLAAQKLLQFARYSTQTSDIKRRRIQPAPLVRETVEVLNDRVRLAECTVDLDLPPDSVSVSLDAQGIQQVLFNLLTNALDASKPGGQVNVRARVEGGFFELSVEDQGCGMSEELLRHVKEPFVTTKEAGKGTGLGLAISDSIVQRHGGELVIDSKLGVGTTMTVRVPIGVYGQGSGSASGPTPRHLGVKS